LLYLAKIQEQLTVGQITYSAKPVPSIIQWPE